MALHPLKTALAGGVASFALFGATAWGITQPSPGPIVRTVPRAPATAPATTAGPRKVTVQRIVPAQPSGAAPDQIGVVLFFDFSPASLRLIRELRSWGGETGTQIVLDREPLPSMGSDPLVRAFIVGRRLGVASEILPALFKLAAHLPPAGQIQRALADVFKPWGIEPVAFDAAWKSPRTSAGVTRALALEARYQVSSAPVIVVNGVWRIAAPPGTSPQALIAALNGRVAAVATSEAENQ